MFARHFIDSLDFAHNGRELSDDVPLSEMPRLQDVLALPDGKISFVLRGVPDKDGKPMLNLAVEGNCRLRCQRCLNGVDYPLRLVSHLILVPPEELDEFAEDDSGEADCIPASKQLDVLDMIEEEILLNLPFAPMHPSGECQSAVESFGSDKPNPFAILASLKYK